MTTSFVSLLTLSCDEEVFFPGSGPISKPRQTLVSAAFRPWNSAVIWLKLKGILLRVRVRLNHFLSRGVNRATRPKKESWHASSNNFPRVLLMRSICFLSVCLFQPCVGCSARMEGFARGPTSAPVPRAGWDGCARSVSVI